MSEVNTQQTSPRKPRIFIASSSEAREIAMAVKGRFEPFGDVDYWSENISLINKSALENLVNLSAFYDFAVAIFTKDDEATIRSQQVVLPRDNVIFEFGLFLGRLGPDRAYFIAEEGVNIFSDWAGINKLEFQRRDPLAGAVGMACFQVEQSMKSVISGQRFTLLPSTALAFGYYDNFLARLYDAFYRNPSIRFYKTDENGREIRGSGRSVRTKGRKYRVIIEVPQILEDLEVAQLHFSSNDYYHVSLKSGLRSYPFYIRSNANLDDPNAVLDLFDIPTTLLSSRRAIKKYFDQAFLDQGEFEKNEEIIEKREIANFKRTLEILIKQNGQRNYFTLEDWTSE